MIRDPKTVQTSDRTVTRPQAKRFQVTPLEERIAPRCQTNPHGKEVGNCKDDGTK